MGIRKGTMAWQMYRAACRCVVRLHPEMFREQFGEQMLGIFEEATETHGALRLLNDGLISLLRQRVLRPGSSGLVLAEPASSLSQEVGFFAWEHIGASPSRLPAGRWMQGGLMSLALFAAVWVMANQAGRRMPASFGTDSEPGSTTRGLTAAVSGEASEGTSRGAWENRVYAGASSRDLREAQRQQQRVAVQVAVGARVIPGATMVAVESQGLVPEVPKTAAGTQFSTWLRAFNSGDRTQIEEVRKLFTNPPGPNVDGDMAFRKMTGGFDLRKIEESSATRMSGLVQERSSDQFAHFSMVVEENAPHRITEWHLDAVATPSGIRGRTAERAAGRRGREGSHR